jgi:Stathmin family
LPNIETQFSINRIDQYLHFYSLFPATEIRCQEKSKGGLSYEVILAEPNASAQQPKLQKSLDKQVSVEDIEVKLKAAEDRRLVSDFSQFVWCIYSNFDVSIVLGGQENR